MTDKHSRRADICRQAPTMTPRQYTEAVKRWYISEYKITAAKASTMAATAGDEHHRLIIWHVAQGGSLSRSILNSLAENTRSRIFHDYPDFLPRFNRAHPGNPYTSPKPA